MSSPIPHSRSPETPHPVETGVQPAVQPATPRKRRRWKRRLGVLLLALLSLAVAAPYIASSSLVRDFILSKVNHSILGNVAVEDVSLSWFGPTIIKGIRVADPDGRDVVDVSEIWWEGGVWRAIASRFDLGEVRVQSPRVVLYFRDDNDISLVRAFASRRPSPEKGSAMPPPLRGRVLVAGGSLQLARHDGRTYEIPRLDLRADAQTSGTLKASLTAGLVDGQSVSAHVAVDKLLVDGRFRADKAEGIVKLTTSGDVDLAGPIRFVFSGVRAAGKLNLSIEGGGGFERPSGTFSASFKGLEIAREGTTDVNPTDIALNGQVRLEGRRLSAEARLTGKVGTAEVRCAHANVATPVHVSWNEVVSAVLTGRNAALPDVRIDAKSNIDLAELARAMPAVLSIRPDARVTAGTITIDNLMLRGGDEPAIKGAIRLAGIAAVVKGRQTAFEPISVDLDAFIERDRGLNVQQAVLASGFAEVDAAGSVANLNAVVRKADLGTLHQQLSGLVDLGATEWAGSLAGNVVTKRISDDRFETAGRLTATGFRIKTGEGEVSFDRAAFNHQGQLVLTNRTLTRIEASAVGADIDGKVVAAVAGSYDVGPGTFRAAIDLRQADVGYIAGRVAGFGFEEMRRCAGVAQLQTDVERKATGALAIGKGTATVRNALVDGSPVSEGDITLGWGRAQLPAAFDRIEVAAVELNAGITRATASNLIARWGEPFTADGTLEATADIAKCLAVAAPHAKWEKIPAIAGPLTLAARCTTAGARLSVAGRAQIAPLTIGRDRQAVRQDMLELICETTLNTRDDSVTLSRAQLTSRPLNVQLRGRVTELSTLRNLDLTGNYEGAWEQIMPFIYELAPGTKGAMSLTGRTASALAVTGPANRPTIEPVYRDVKSGLDVLWTSGSAWGLSLGQAKLSPLLADGKLVIPLTAIPASGGQLRLGGTIDLKPPDPVFTLPEKTRKLQVLERVKITPELGRHMLSRVNPLFGFMVRTEGTATLAAEDLRLPLGESIKTDASGRGRLDLRDFKVQFGGPLASLLELGGFGTQDALSCRMEGVDFALEKGRIRYDNLTMVFPENFDMRFSGSVGFDDTLDLKVSVPVRTALLKRFGVSGPLLERVKLVESMRVTIPIKGSRQAPKPDFAEVEIKPIIEALTKNAIAGEAGAIIDTMRKQRQEPDEKSRHPSPRAQPDTKPVEQQSLDLLKDVLKKDSEKPPKKK